MSSKLRENMQMLAEAVSVEKELDAFVGFLKSKLLSDFYEAIVSSDKLILKLIDADEDVLVNTFCDLCHKTAGFKAKISASNIVQYDLNLDKDCASLIGVFHACNEFKQDLATMCFGYKNMDLGVTGIADRLIVVLRDKAYLDEVITYFNLYKKKSNFF